MDGTHTERAACCHTDAVTPYRKPLKAYLNVARMRFEWWRGRTVLRSRPIAAYVEPTTICNLRCPACPTGLRLPIRQREAVSEERFRAFIDGLRDSVFLLYMYNWGEPLLHPQTPELIRYAKSRDMQVSLSSNLNADLSDDYIERLVTSGLDKLVVSCDGASQQTYAAYRRGGNLQRVRDTLARIRRSRDSSGRTTPEIILQFLMFSHNQQELDQVQRDFGDWGADSLTTFAPFLSFADGPRELQPAADARYNLLSPANPLQQKAAKLLAKRQPCSILYSMVALNPNGSVSPCCASAYEADDFGTFDSAAGIAPIWNNAKYQAARSLQTSPHAGQWLRALETTSEELPWEAAAMQNAPGAELGRSLVCLRCPAPAIRDFAHELVGSIAWLCVRSAWRDRSLRPLLGLMLMGGPNRTVWRHGWSRLWGAVRGIWQRARRGRTR